MYWPQEPGGGRGARAEGLCPYSGEMLEFRGSEWRMLARRTLAVMGISAAVGAAGWASPATFVTALPVATDQLLVRFNFQSLIGTQQFLGIQLPVNIGYGLTSRWAIFVNFNQGYGTLGGGPTSPALSSWGAGDATVFARYTIFKIDKPRSTFRIAPLAGADLPSGDNGLRNHGAYLPGILQTGSGTVDPYVGVTMGYNSSNWGMAADTTYRYNPVAGMGISPGSELRSDGQIEARVYPKHLPEEGLPAMIVVSFEANYTKDAAAHVDGVLSPLSPAQTLKEDLFVEYGTLHWQIGLGGQWPVMQSFDTPGHFKESAGAFLFFEYYLSAPDWRHRRHST